MEDLNERLWYRLLCGGRCSWAFQRDLMQALGDRPLCELSGGSSLTSPVLQRAWMLLHRRPPEHIPQPYDDFKAQGGMVIYPGSPYNLALAHYFALASAHHSLPALLAAKGCVRALENTKRVAVVGLRQGTPTCLEMARKIGRYFARAGYTVLSGHAKGVDTYAHLGALEGGGDTVMVLPHNLNAVLRNRITTYLRKELRERIPTQRLIRNTLWLSPFDFQQRYTRYTPLQRNSVLCALSAGVVAVCTARGSGSYQAAKEARKMNQPVFVWRHKEHYPHGNRLLEEKYAATSFRGVRELTRSLEH